MNDATQTGVAMASIAMISTVIGSVVNYFTNRDKLRFDADMAALKAQNATQAAEMEELKADNAACQKAGEARDKRIADLEQKLTDHLNRGTAQRAALPSTV